MGCCSSKQIDDTTRDVGPTEPKPATNAASPDTNISTARSDEHSLRTAERGPEISVSGSDVQVSLPTGRDLRQFESSGRAAGWAETTSIRPPAVLTHAGSENGGLGQTAGPDNTDHNTTASERPKTPLSDSPHRSIPRAMSQTVVGGFNPPETPGQALPAPPPAQYRRRSISATPDEALESKRHSWAKQFAPGGSLPASTDPDIRFSHPSNDSSLRIRLRLEIAELRDGLSSASGKFSERLKALDLTGQLMERTEPKFRGHFSDVSQAKVGDCVVAVKALRVGSTEGGESRMRKRLAREIYVWAALDHANVLELLGFTFEDGRPCLISPWCDNGTLKEYLQKFPDANRRRLVREIADGLRYLHLQSPPIIHGDLKTTNVFVTGDHVAKISDFGTSRRVELLKTGFTTDGLVLATIRYTAPEILRDGQHPAPPSDVFSFACVALETMTDTCPFWKITNVIEVIGQVVFKMQTPSPEDHPGMEDAVWELLRSCWSYEPSGRPKMIDVCQMLAVAGYGPPANFGLPARTGSSTTFYPPTHGEPSLTSIPPTRIGLTV